MHGERIDGVYVCLYLWKRMAYDDAQCLGKQAAGSGWFGMLLAARYVAIYAQGFLPHAKIKHAFACSYLQYCPAIRSHVFSIAPVVFGPPQPCANHVPPLAFRHDEARVADRLSHVLVV